MLRPKFSIILTMVLFFGIVIAGLVQAQTVKKLKLPNGEEVVDLNGEWDTRAENYGDWIIYGKFSTIEEIKQEGSSFVGIRLKATTYHSAGTVSFRGELDKDGIKKLQLMTGMGPIDAVGKISDDGKTIMIDAHDKVKSTMTRK